MKAEPVALPDLTPEQELLCLCARTRIEGPARERLHALLERPLDWMFVLAHAAEHGIVPLLHHHLREASETADGLVPAALLDKLQRVCIAGTARRLLLVSELKAVLSELEAAGAKAVVWKGPVLAHSVYPSPDLRPFSDLDLLVRRSDVHRARGVLRARGYSLQPGLALPEEEQFARSDHTVPMVNDRTGVSVDLHWGAGIRYFSSAMDTDELCEQFHSLPVGDAAVAALKPEALLLAMSAHGAKHRPYPWPKLKWVTDVEAFLRSYPEERWESLLARARRTGSHRMVLLGTCLAHELLGAPVPTTVMAAIDADPEVKRLATDISRRIVAEDPPEFTFAERVRFDLAVRERLRDRVRYRLRRLLTTSPRDVEAIRLPTKLRILQLPLRLVRLATKYVLHPSRIRALFTGQEAPRQGRHPDPHGTRAGRHHEG